MCIRDSQLTGHNNPASGALDLSWAYMKKAFLKGVKYYYAAFGLWPDEGWKMISLLCSSGCCGVNFAMIDSYSRSYLKPRMRFWHFPMIWKLLYGSPML